MSKKHILLTGGTGFIGRNIIEKLGVRYNIYCPTRKQLDLTDARAVDRYFIRQPVDIVIHTAFIGGDRDVQLVSVVETNLRMFFNLIRNHGYFQKLINLGSGAEYGKHKPITKVSESEFGKFVPEDEYGFSKYVIANFIEETDLPIVNLRLFGVYGKYEDYWYRFISYCLSRLAFDKPIVINQNAIFDYLYINDLINIVNYFISHDSKHKSYNVGTGRPIELLDIAKIALKVTNKKLPVKIKKRGLSREYTLNNARLKQEIPGLKFTKMVTALSELYKWYKANKPKLDKSLLK